MRNVVTAVALIVALTSCSRGSGKSPKDVERSARRAYAAAVAAAREKVMSCEDFMTRGDTEGWHRCSDEAVKNQLKAQAAYQNACEVCATPDRCAQEVRRVKQAAADAAGETACP